MNQYRNRSKAASIALAATPIVVLATYIAWIVVPIVIAQLIPTVVHALTTK